MPEKRPANLQFPLGGQDESQPYQRQQPYTTPDSQNVRPEGTIERRARGGSRPGLTPAANRVTFVGPFTTGSQTFPAAIRMMAQFDHQKTDGISFFVDPFNTSIIGGQWTAGTWANIDALFSSYEKKYASADPTDETAGVLRALADFDSTADYMISILIAPYEQDHHGKYTIYFYLNDSNPDFDQDGAKAELVLESSSGAYSGSFTQKSGGGFGTGGAFQNPGTDGSVLPGIFSILVSGLNVTAYWRGRDIGTITLDTWDPCSGAEGERVGLGINCTQNDLDGTTSISKCLVDWFRIEYKDSDTGQRTTTIIVSDGKPYREEWIGRYKQVGSLGGITLPKDKLTLAAARGGLLYIADPTAVRTYTPASDTLATLTASAGSVPTGVPLIAVYRDRLVVAGADASPNQWFMSRQGDFTGWDYSLRDSGAAVSGSTNAAGQIGEPIRAMAAWLDNFLIFGCTNSLWVLKGDPVFGGQMYSLSTTIGVLDLGSYCFGPSGEFIFLSDDGLYYIEPGAQSRPKSISRDKLPQELRHVDRKAYTVLMAYDYEYQGVHIYLTSEDQRAGRHWWMPWPEGTFWPVELQADDEPTAILEYQSYDPSQNGVVLGCRDFSMRRYHDDAHNDDGTEITSYVSIGPLRPSGSDYHDGILTEIWATLAENSGDVTWSIKPSDTPEGTIDATAQETGTWSAGLNGREHPRVRAGSVLLRLENADTNKRWAIEHVEAIMQKAGKHRIP